jgi:hypothetical protein
MRFLATALSLAALCSPAVAQDCRFFNANGQSLEYRPLDGEVVFDPLYADKVMCAFIGQPVKGNGYELACDDGPSALVIGMSEPDKPFVDILVFDSVFFWLKCEETT